MPVTFDFSIRLVRFENWLKTKEQSQLLNRINSQGEHVTIAIGTKFTPKIDFIVRKINYDNKTVSYMSGQLILRKQAPKIDPCLIDNSNHVSTNSAELDHCHNHY